LNTFLLTTDGRVFSWGSFTPCLGRDFKSESMPAGKDTDDESSVENEIGEIEFT